jgi:hypothetical protein
MARPFPDPDKERDALRTFLEKGAETTIDVLETFKAAGEVTATLDKPATLTFDVTAGRLVEQIGEDQEQRVLLDLGTGDLLAPTGFFVHLFLNAPDATADTSEREPGFETGFSFFCEPGKDVPEMACPIGPVVTTTRFDVTGKLRGLATPDLAITATLVVVPTVEGGAKEVALSIKTAELSHVKSVVKIAS